MLAEQSHDIIARSARSRFVVFEFLAAAVVRFDLPCSCPLLPPLTPECKRAKEKQRKLRVVTAGTSSAIASWGVTLYTVNDEVGFPAMRGNSLAHEKEDG